MEVKICGLCRPEDAWVAAAAGADFAGVILAPGSPRSQSAESAERIFAVAGSTRRVGVFVDAPNATVLALRDRLGLHVAQLHGREAPDDVETLRRSMPVWKALRPRTASELATLLERYANIVDGILLDGFSPTAAGGSGTAFPWEQMASIRTLIPPDTRLIVAGGLTPDNVGRAIDLLSPHVVDVSSGVESAPGIKSAARIHAFLAQSRTSGQARIGR